MRLSVVFLVLIFATVALAQAPPGAQKPLGKNQIMDLVKAGMESEELAKTVQERGIDFEWTDDYLQALRQAGAQDVLVKALRAVKPKPMTGEQVLQLVVGSVPSQRVAALVRQRGIDFLPDEEYIGTLRVGGAEEMLLSALRTAGEATTTEMVVATSPNAEVYLDGELKGRANAQGDLAMKAKLGAHALKVTLAGKKDFERSVTLASVQATRVEAQLADLIAAGTVRENPKDGLKYVWIPPGTFQMGCSPGDNQCGNNEKPPHQVTITKGYWLGQTEVTVGAYKRFARQTGRGMPAEPAFPKRSLNPRWSNDQMPIVNVTWDDAEAYCRWVGGRLPTEAEWEYAARGGSTEARYGLLDDIAWCAENSGQQRLDTGQLLSQGYKQYLDRFAANGHTMWAVSLKRPNAFSLYDILGNVSEWVSDWYAETYYQASPARDPSGPDSGQFRVLRGGSWNGLPRTIRVSARDWGGTANWLGDDGVRCCGGEAR